MCPDAAASDRSVLSVLIPVFNERDLLPTLIERVEAVALPAGVERQLVIIDDGSTDGTAEWLDEEAVARDAWTVCFHQRNYGKGAAVRTGLGEARGEIVLIQDGDLEYDPADYPQLIRPILDDRADVVFGSRYIGGGRRVPRYWHKAANQCLTRLSNMCANLALTDMECCYKVFRRSVLERISLREHRFGFEPEVVAKVARLKMRIWETPVAHDPRGYGQGKKIGWRDGVSALRCILRYNLLPQRSDRNTANAQTPL